MSEHPEDHWGLTITSEPEIQQKVMDWLRAESLNDPLANQLYSLMIMREIPLLNVLFAMAQVKSKQAKDAIARLLDFYHTHPMTSLVRRGGL